MSAVSTNYRELTPDEVAEVAAECATAWQDPDIPARQYALAVRGEMDNWKQGIPVAPFSALVRTVRQLPAEVLTSHPRLLDIGASGGYYREVLMLAGFDMQYTGLDFSAAFKRLAWSLYPDITFDVGDARALPYRDDEFDVVLNGATMMHVREYEQIIRETARVTFRYAIFHRTPISDRTRFFRKEAYGVPCLEIWFGEAELFGLFAKYGLHAVFSTDVFRNETFAHRTYLLGKDCTGLRHHSV